MIHTARFMLYCVLFVFAVVVLALSGVRLYYTTHIPLGDPTNYGVPFYDLIVLELLVTSILTTLWAGIAASAIRNKLKHRFLRSFAAELASLFILFLLWLVGAAIATRTSNPPEVDVYWGNLSSCWSHWQCRTLTAMLAFAWLSWIVVVVLLVLSLWFAITNKAFREPMHGRGPATQYSLRNLP